MSATRYAELIAPPGENVAFRPRLTCILDAAAGIQRAKLMTSTAYPVRQSWGLDYRGSKGFQVNHNRSNRYSVSSSVTLLRMRVSFCTLRKIPHGRAPLKPITPRSRDHFCNFLPFTVVMNQAAPTQPTLYIPIDTQCYSTRPVSSGHTNVKFFWGLLA
jgi:hypothetical protein